MGGEVIARAAAVVAGLTLHAACIDAMEPSAQELAVPNSCISPTDAPSCPAVAGDGADDRCGFAWAVAEAKLQDKQVCIPGGVFDLSYQMADGAKASIDLDALEDFTLAGAGPATVLRFITGGQDVPSDGWRMIYVHASTNVTSSNNVTLRDFAIDGNAAGIDSNDDRTFGIMVGESDGPVRRVTITNVDIYNSDGDAIGLYGSNKIVDDIEISHSRFTNNGRSGITFQRGSHRVAVTNNVFISTSDSDIDFEPSNGGSQDVLIENNTFLRDNICTAVSLSGTSGNDLDRLSFSDNLVIGGSIRIGNASNLLLSRNLVIAADASICAQATPAFALNVGAFDVTFRDNVAIKPCPVGASCFDGPVFAAPSPTRLTIDGDVYIQRSFAPILELGSPEDTLITGTRLVFDNGGTASQKHGITINAAARAVRGLTISGNEIAGSAGGSSLLTAVTLQTSGAYPYSGVTITGNRGTGVKFGVDLTTEPSPTCAAGNCSACCDPADPDCTTGILQTCPTQLCRTDNANSCAYDEVPVVTDNAFTVTAGGADLRPNNRTVIGGNSTRPWWMGARSPTIGVSGSCPTGALFTRSGTGSGSKLCVCEAGAWREKSVTGGPCL